MAKTLTIPASEPGEPTVGDERLLLNRVARGEPAALERLIEQHQARVAGLAFRLLGWRDEVEDVVQDVFAKILQNLSSFRGECRLATWLYRITVNECRRWRRRQLLRIQRWPGTRGRGEPDGVGRAVERESLDRVRTAVAGLPAKYREVVVLRYLEELPVAQVSEILGLRPNTVEVRLSRARQHLKDVLAELTED